MKRKYVLTLRLTTDSTRAAGGLRRSLRILAGGLDAETGIRLTTQTQDGPVITEPVVLMERIVE